MIDRRLLLAGLAATPLTACATAPDGAAQAGGPSLTLVTFNIWHNQGDWAARLPLLILKERRLYAVAREDPTRIPMGNSLWRAEVFQRVGRFDERLAGGGEDWDLALRARAAGFTGALVDQAWVEHDLTRASSTIGVLRKQFRYDVGGAMAYIKNHGLRERAAQRSPRVGWHWTDLVAPVSKAAALPLAWWRLRKRTP